jgi:hypothetical protein
MQGKPQATAVVHHLLLGFCCSATQQIRKKAGQTVGSHPRTRDESQVKLSCSLIFSWPPSGTDIYVLVAQLHA